MDPEERRRLIRRYRDGFVAVSDALAKITPARIDLRRTSEDWTAREIVHHLADMEMASAVRLRRLLAEASPLLQWLDEEEYARRLYYDRPIEASLAVFKAARDTSADILECLSDAEWLRDGTHSKDGAYSVDIWLQYYAEHPHDHAAQMLRSLG